jgi:N-acetylmuramic acid 6-phosphate etherase
MKSKDLYKQLAGLTTESRNPRSTNIESASIAAALRIINNEDKTVAHAVEKEIPKIAAAVKLVVSAFKNGGRLIYVGAGTSGRLGILDAAECPPTYGTDPKMVQAIIAGGRNSVFRSKEGAEDKESNGAKAIGKVRLTKHDVVCGIAASTRTPFVIGALIAAKKAGAKTAFVTANPRRVLNQSAFKRLRSALDVAVCVDVGPEVIMGSTRMKSGTGQKLVLNMISTTSMVQIGKVYQNMMVDLKLSNKKLIERAKRVIMISTGVDYTTASVALKNSGGSVKTAIVMLAVGVSVDKARNALDKSGGFVKKAIRKKPLF